MNQSDTIAAQVLRLRREVSDHKAAIGRHRRALWTAKDHLTRLEADCERLGIRILAEGSTASHGHVAKDPAA